MENEPLLTYDEALEYLNEVAQALPQEVYARLNGGILLQPETVPSPYSLNGDLYTLGTYFYDPYGLGRYICIYYGSFTKIARGQTTAQQKATLREVLLHEFTHHLESMAGVRDLEVEDEAFLEEYYRGHGRQG